MWERFWWTQILVEHRHSIVKQVIWMSFPGVGRTNRSSRMSPITTAERNKRHCHRVHINRKAPLRNWDKCGWAWSKYVDVLSPNSINWQLPRALKAWRPAFWQSRLTFTNHPSQLGLPFPICLSASQTVLFAVSHHVFLTSGCLQGGVRIRMPDRRLVGRSSHQAWKKKLDFP